jgi:hypothetical protein
MTYYDCPPQDNAGPLSPDTSDWPICSDCGEPRNERLYKIGEARLCSTCNEAMLERKRDDETAERLPPASSKDSRSAARQRIKARG